MELEFSNTPTKLIGRRNSLLQHALRDEKLPFSIADECPIILNEKYLDTSFCYHNSEEVVSHLSLWKRKIICRKTNTTFKVGLIGNVATNSNWRQKGYSKKLLLKTTAKAKDQGLDALILWSDLNKFYQKLGFLAQGKEFRYYLPKNSTFLEPMSLETASLDVLSNTDLEQMLKLRPNLELEQNRSIDEFRALLTTPWTQVYTLRNLNSKIIAFAIIGKGYDLMGVVHEWGLQPNIEPEIFFQSLAGLINFNEIIILSPHPIGKNFASNTKGRMETHPLALFKIFNQDLNPNQLFLWGLDSI